MLSTVCVQVCLLAYLFVCLLAYLFVCLINQLIINNWLKCLIRPDLFGRKKVLLIFGGLWHDDHNLTPVDSTPVNCGEDKMPGGLTLHSLRLECPPSGWGRGSIISLLICFDCRYDECYLLFACKFVVVMPITDSLFGLITCLNGCLNERIITRMFDWLFDWSFV